jgi:MFS family permease
MQPSPPLTLLERHRARRLAYWNGGVWALGNGLSSSMLVVFLAYELGVPHWGVPIALILSARHFVGVLRLGTPALLSRVGNRKAFCIGAYLLSGLLLLMAPWLAVPGRLPSPRDSLIALIGLWSAHHLMQYLGLIVLYSWLADLAPVRIRGRFFGRQNRWMVLGEAVSAVAAGLFVVWWKKTFPDEAAWRGYALLAVLGAVVMLLALIPLGRMPEIRLQSAVQKNSWKRLFDPLSDRCFRRLIIFFLWFSFSNGMTGTVQISYPKAIVPVAWGLAVLLWSQTAMRLGQMGVSPWLGRVADRVGNRRMMLVCLLLTAQGPLFYVFSTPQQWWWFLGASAVWIAYAGMNVGLPNLMLKLAPPAEKTEYLSMYFTLSGLAYAGSTLLGGYLDDRFGGSVFSFGGWEMSYAQCVFLFGWIARCLGLVLLWRVIEPANGRLPNRQKG